MICLRSVTSTRLHFALFYHILMFLFLLSSLCNRAHTPRHTHTHTNTHSLLSLTLLHRTEPLCNVHRLKAEVASQSQNYHQQNKVRSELKYFWTDYFHFHFKSLDIWFWLKLLYHKVIIFIFNNDLLLFHNNIYHFILFLFCSILLTFKKFNMKNLWAPLLLTNIRRKKSAKV